MFFKRILYLSSVLLVTVLACSSQSSSLNSVEKISYQSDTVLAEASVVDTSIASIYVHKQMKFKVILPSNYKIFDSLPLIYLLHGYGGNETSYLAQLENLKKLVDSVDVVLVCVNGDVSWYANNQVKKDLNYEDYLVKELFPFVQQNYKVGKGNAQHGIAGLSMGGYGSLYIAFKHPELFSYVGGSSACVDIKPYPANWGLKNIFGELEGNEKRYEANSPFYMIDSMNKADFKFRLVLDCGDVDFFFEDNNRFHDKLNEKGIKHEYYTSPGDHKWEYWRVSIPNHIKRFVSTVR